MLCKSQGLPDVLQVIFTTACELVTPKHVVPGTLKILQGQLQFTGDLLPEEGLPNSPQEGPATKAKVSILRMAYEQASFCMSDATKWPVCVMFSLCLTVVTRPKQRWTFCAWRMNKPHFCMSDATKAASMCNVQSLSDSGDKAS